MSAEHHKTIARRYFEEVYNGRNDVLAHELFADDFHDYSEASHHGLRRPLLAKHIVDFERSVFPDIHFAVEDMVAEEDKLVVRLTIRGTHQGEFRGIPPSGRAVTITGIECFRFADGKIAEVVWHLYDQLSMLRQFGVLSEMG